MDETEEKISPTVQALLDRIQKKSEEALFTEDAVYDCPECEDLHWVRIERTGDYQKGEADHYMRPCSQCLPERYRIMVVEDCGRAEHISKGGCRNCRQYVQPWTNVGKRG